MTDQPTFNRRRVLELSGVGTTLAVAGCTSQLDDDEVDGDENGDRGELADDERRVTMAVQVDQEALQQRQMELQQQAQAGEIDQEEFQAEIESLQAELIEEALENVRTEFEAFDLTIEDTLDEGILLVAGPATDLIDAVDLDIIQALAGGALFEQAQQAQQQSVPEEGAAPEDEPVPENEPVPEDEPEQ